MIKTSIKTLPLLLLPIVSQADMTKFHEARELINSAQGEIREAFLNAPTTYEFQSRFYPEKSSVSYSGQTLRQVLISDIKSFMSSIKRGNYPGNEEEALDTLLSFYEFSLNGSSYSYGSISGDEFLSVYAKDTTNEEVDTLEEFYSDLTKKDKNLKEKMAGIDNEELFHGRLLGVEGFDTPHELLQSWLEEYAGLATGKEKTLKISNGEQQIQKIEKASVTKDGRDLTQLVQKFLHGAVSFSQAARDYMYSEKGLNADNQNQGKKGSSYTTLEHYWDEGFGYFGAARDYLNYTDMEIYKKQSIDTNKDSLISLKSEKNLGLSPNASRMDLIASQFDFDMNLNEDTMRAFIEGRHLISKNIDGSLPYIKAQAIVALTSWERVLAAVTIHYINSTINQMKSYGTKNYLFSNHAKYWSEMKGFALSFQFNPHSPLSKEEFIKLHELIKDSPVLGTEGLTALKVYEDQLVDARTLLTKTYEFNTTEKW